MPPANPLRVVSANVNGIRAAYRRGMGEWLAGRDVDILAMQEVRASTEDVQALLGDEWDILHDPATAKGRAGVAIASRNRASIHRVEQRASAKRCPDVRDRAQTIVSDARRSTQQR